MSRRFTQQSFCEFGCEGTTMVPTTPNTRWLATPSTCRGTARAMRAATAAAIAATIKGSYCDSSCSKYEPCQCCSKWSEQQYRIPRKHNPNVAAKCLYNADVDDDVLRGANVDATYRFQRTEWQCGLRCNQSSTSASHPSHGAQCWDCAA